MYHRDELLHVLKSKLDDLKDFRKAVNQNNMRKQCLLHLNSECTLKHPLVEHKNIQYEIRPLSTTAGIFLRILYNIIMLYT